MKNDTDKLNEWWWTQYNQHHNKSITDQIMDGIGYGALWSIAILGWWVVFSLTKLGAFS